MNSGGLGGGFGGANISMQLALGDSFQRAAERGVHESKLDILERQIGNFAEQGTDADVAGAVVDASSNDARVYVDGEALTAYAQTSAELNNLALSLGVDVEAIKKAADNGSSVAISLGGFEATALKHENFFQEVKDNLSFEDGGITNANEKLRQMQAEVKKAEADKAIALEESAAAALQEEQDAVLSTMLTAGVPRSQANLVMELLTARAKVMNPENPAQWMRENGLKFQKGGNAIGFSQAQYKSDAKSIKEYVAKIKAANIPPQGKGKFFYSFKSSNGADFYIAHDDMKHSYEKHGLTDGQLDAVESNIENITGAAVDNKKKGHNNGVPVLAKIKTPAGMAGVAFEFHPNGTVGINTIFFDSEANIDNWLKKGGSSTIVPLEEQTSLTGNTPLSISNIQKALGIVKKENYDQVSATPEEIEAVRQQYEGTEQWMKAPNGKTTNLTEDQWLAVRTPAFKEWFGDWEAAYKKNYLRNGKPVELSIANDFESMIPAQIIKDYLDGKENSKGAMAKAIRKYLPNVVKGTVLGEVNISNYSLSDTLHHSGGIGKVSTLIIVDKLLKNGVEVGNRKIENDTTSHILATPLIADGAYKGERFVVMMVVNEDRNGKKFYDHELTTIKNLMKSLR